MGGKALSVARELTGAKDPQAMARACAVTFEGTTTAGTFTIPFFSAPVRITWPALELAPDSRPVPDHMLALLLYHLSQSDGTPPAGEDISFADLPNGSIYVTAFRGYTTAPLVTRFASAPNELAQATARLGATPQPSAADKAWRIPALPRVPLLLLWWDADDEFDARTELLFDQGAPHHLTTDGCAVLGSWMSHLLRD